MNSTRPSVHFCSSPGYNGWPIDPTAKHSSKQILLVVLNVFSLPCFIIVSCSTFPLLFLLLYLFVLTENNQMGKYIKYHISGNQLALPNPLHFQTVHYWWKHDIWHLPTDILNIGKKSLLSRTILQFWNKQFRNSVLSEKINNVSLSYTNLI